MPTAHKKGSAVTKSSPAAQSQGPKSAEGQNNQRVEAKTTHLDTPKLTATNAEPEPSCQNWGCPKKTMTVSKHTDSIAQETTLEAKTGKCLHNPADIIENQPLSKWTRTCENNKSAH